MAAGKTPIDAQIVNETDSLGWNELAIQGVSPYDVTASMATCWLETEAPRDGHWGRTPSS